MTTYAPFGVEAGDVNNRKRYRLLLLCILMICLLGGATFFIVWYFVFHHNGFMENMPTIIPSGSELISKINKNDSSVIDTQLILPQMSLQYSKLFYNEISLNKYSSLIDNHYYAHSSNDIYKYAIKNDGINNNYTDSCLNWLKNNSIPYYYKYFYEFNNDTELFINQLFNHLSNYYTLNFYDLYTGNIFYEKYTETVGILFKAKAFPSKIINNEDIHYSICQNTSYSTIDEYQFEKRNILYMINNKYQSNMYIIKTGNGTWVNKYMDKNIDKSISITNFMYPIYPYSTIFKFGNTLYAGNNN